LGQAMTPRQIQGCSFHTSYLRFNDRNTVQNLSLFFGGSHQG
jgi:hypothetical protein